jgi:primosomal protein N' (replication factor Y)
MHRFIEVVFNLPLSNAFTYELPAEIQRVKPGMRVLAPFGKRAITGVVIASLPQSKFSQTKKIIDVLDKEPLISSKMLELMKWISDYYLCSYGQALQLALPKGIEIEEKEMVYLEELREDVQLTTKQMDLYQLIGSSPGKTKKYYQNKYGQGPLNHILSILESKNLIYIERELSKKKANHITRKMVLIEENYHHKKKKYEDYLKYIKKRPEVDAFMAASSGRNILFTDFIQSTQMSPATLRKMARYELCKIFDSPIERTPKLTFSEAEKNIKLTDEQKNALSKIQQSLKVSVFKTFLLLGVTGSGKTHVYIEAVKKTLALGKSAIILIPEIALTPQTVGRFMNYFGENVVVFHSKMSLGERYDTWFKCYKREASIAIGPRSALFVPLTNIGLIVVDEEHEASYKQNDPAPRYHARDVAVYMAKMNNAVIILGSATPSLESFSNCHKNKFELLELKKRAVNRQLPAVHIVDMKRGTAIFKGKATQFSKELLEKIEDRLSKEEQIIILLNRRGYASFLQCQKCFYIPMCPNCDVSLIYHSYSHKLRCHLCAHEQKAFGACPSCGDQQVAYKGLGTQKIQKELNRIFPSINILRMDQDTTQGKNKHDSILSAFGNKEASILLGTQMIAKGLDFENVTLVGVIAADIGLTIPDFRSPERVFQLLTQVAGRAGRGKKAGEVIIQTSQNKHYAVVNAAEHNFDDFYLQEAKHRQKYNFPPHLKMIQVLVSGTEISLVIKSSRNIAFNMNKLANQYCSVIGPSPAMIPKVKSLNRWQIILKLNHNADKNGSYTKNILKSFLKDFNKIMGYGIRVTVDVDPILIN